MLKKSILTILIVFMAFGSIAICLMWYRRVHMESRLALESISDSTNQSEVTKYLDLMDKYQNEQKYGLAAEASRKAIQIGGKEAVGNYLQNRYRRQVIAIDKSWETIREGDGSFKAGNYEAAAAYEQAYALGERAVGGISLATTYEKMGQYDKAVAFLESMIQKKQLSELGIQDAKEMIARLLAAKAQQQGTSA